MASFSYRAFTLAELIVVVGILSIVGVMGYQAMASFSYRASTESVSSRIRSQISEQDRNVRDGLSSSYEALFRTGSLGFSVSTDFDTSYSSGSIKDVSWNAMTGSFSFVPSGAIGSESWIVRISADSKVQSTLTFSGTVLNRPISLSPDRHDEVSITPSINAVTTNRLLLFSYDRDNFMTSVPREKKLEFVEAESGSAKGNFSIRNVAGKKEFLVSGVSVGQATLHFVS